MPSLFESREERLGLAEFGRRLVATGDLDPVYFQARSIPKENGRLARWLLAYWMCYDAGTSCYMSDLGSDDWWSAMSNVAANRLCPLGGSWPRGVERRHFRGEKARDAAWSLRSRYGRPEEFVYALCEHESARGIMEYVCGHYMFGLWIAFKAADMMERVYGQAVRFSFDDLKVFSVPIRGAELFVTQSFPDTRGMDAFRVAAGYLMNELSGISAPPQNDRPLGIQEVETILCKWKSHRSGGYWVGKDIHETRASLRRWADLSMSAAVALDASPGEVE